MVRGGRGCSQTSAAEVDWFVLSSSFTDIDSIKSNKVDCQGSKRKGLESIKN